MRDFCFDTTKSIYINANGIILPALGTLFKIRFMLIYAIKTTNIYISIFRISSDMKVIGKHQKRKTYRKLNGRTMSFHQNEKNQMKANKLTMRKNQIHFFFNIFSFHSNFVYFSTYLIIFV